MATAFASRLDRLTSKGGIRGSEIAKLLRLAPETISRWKSGKSEPQHETLRRLLELEFILNEIREFYGPAEARMWIFAPHRLLRGKTPADKIQAGEVDEVIRVIEQLRTGAFA